MALSAPPLKPKHYTLEFLHTQGLPDHAHKPTLERLPKEKPVVCSPAAARVASEMGFKNIYELDHGRSMDFADGRLNIRATIGRSPAALV